MRHYDVYIAHTRVGKVRTLGTRTGKKRLINIFGTIATTGLTDREEDCDFDLDWPTIDYLQTHAHSSWELRRVFGRV